MHEELTSMRIMMENAGVNPEKSLDEEAMMKVMQQFEQLNQQDLEVTKSLSIVCSLLRT